MKSSTKIRNLLILPLLAALSGCISSPAQFMMDREVKRLCELDGGSHVYEQVFLSKENFGPRGEVFAQYRNMPPDQQLGPAYALDTEHHKVEGENPSLWRHHVWVTRRADHKLLGEWVDYHRAGGGLMASMEGNAYSCENISAKYNRGIVSKIFIQEGTSNRESWISIK